MSQKLILKFPSLYMLLNRKNNGLKTALINIKGYNAIKKNNLFGASLSLWWIGQNFVDCAPYINDARVQELILIGGVTGHTRFS